MMIYLVGHRSCLVSFVDQPADYMLEVRMPAREYLDAWNNL